MSYTAKARRPRVLVLTHYYLPGFRGGGPIRSVGNIVLFLGAEFEFEVVTMDRDLGDVKPYAGVQANAWQRCENANVFYLRKSWLSWWTLARLVMSCPHDLVYFNSYFNPLFSIWPLLVLRLARLLGVSTAQILLAPRGEFSRGALQIHSLKKKCFKYLANVFRLHRGITWHASSVFEQADITQAIGAGEVTIGAPISDSKLIFTAADLIGRGSSIDAESRWPRARLKSCGEATIGFISRISPMKNLEFALEVLAGVRGRVRFDIYGPAEDRGYLEMCQRLIDDLPLNITVTIHGELAHADVDGVLRSLHLLLLPTRGENFGHIIYEALSAGCPVLISDRTPWRNLNNLGVGWDLPLDDMASFREVIEEIVAMDDVAFQVRSEASQAYARNRSRTDNSLEQNFRMFSECVRRDT
jgi:glycosyltransferase involved in cell wall biosynthesis